MDNWRLDTFKSLLGQSLRATPIDGEAGGECLFEVSEVIESTSLGEGWESFSVILKSNETVSQGSLNLHAENIGETMVFLTPKSEDEYEAIFNYQL